AARTATLVAYAGSSAPGTIGGTRMTVHASLAAAAAIAGALLFSASAANAQANVCESQAKRIQCSQQCCGLKSCAPACEADCVRACVDACKAPAKEQSYISQLDSYRQRCGNRGLRRG